MRGKAGSRRMPKPSEGITPAHAGKRYAVTAPRAAWPDHPRPCGEKSQTATADRLIYGSPPPMRGKVMCSYAPAWLRRITPAHAGKSTRHPPALTTAMDHPRPCGEKVRRAAWVYVMQGSPPPMRGKAHPLWGGLTARRITPAHAGKSTGLYSEAYRERDHPRPCGEKPFL